MRRGTTPTHFFTLPFETDNLSKIRIVYSQNANPIVVKETEDCVMEGNTVTLTLKQEDTLLFDATKFVNIQVRVLTKGNDSLVSNIVSKAVGECLDNEVLA